MPTNKFGFKTNPICLCDYPVEIYGVRLYGVMTIFMISQVSKLVATKFFALWIRVYSPILTTPVPEGLKMNEYIPVVSVSSVYRT
jgi:hypothetical protein